PHRWASRTIDASTGSGHCFWTSSHESTSPCSDTRHNTCGGSASVWTAFGHCDHANGRDSVFRGREDDHLTEWPGYRPKMRSSTAGGVRGLSLIGKKSPEPKFGGIVIGSIGAGRFQASARLGPGFSSLVSLRRLMAATGPE